MTGPLTGKVALVAGATRGAGRGTAVALGEAGATVYCTGRTTRERRSEYDRPETIEETAELVRPPAARESPSRSTIWSRRRSRRSCERIDAEHGRLDVLVNDIWGGEGLFEWDTPLWEHDLDGGLRMLRLAIETHLITSHFALPLLIRRPGGLVVEMTDGTREYNAASYRVSAFYDLAKTAVHPARLRPGEGARAPRLHRGRADAGLDALGDDARHYGVTEENWRDAAAANPHFAAISESPRFVGRAVAALAADPDVQAATAARSPPAGWRASTASPTSTAPSPTAGATWSRCRTRACRRTRPATAEAPRVGLTPHCGWGRALRGLPRPSDGRRWRCTVPWA